MRTKPSMNPRLLYLLPLMLVFLVFAFRCKESTDPTPENALLSIDLASVFQEDDVLVKLDGDDFYSGTVTTNPSLSLAWRKQEFVSPGSHSVAVFISNRGASGDTSVSVQDTLTVYVTYERNENKIRFTLYNTLIPYR